MSKTSRMFIVATIIGLMAVGFLGGVPLPAVHAATGAYFDNIVVVAMENQNYADVMGTGTGSSNAPFITTLLSKSATIPSYHGYGAAGRTINGCSAACYVALVSGSTYGVGDAYCNTLSGCPGSPTWNAPTFIDRLVAAGGTWQAYCESGCPRLGDHFPFIAFSSIYNSPNIFTGGSVSPSDFIAAANSASPPTFLWYTPTDSNNMHDNSIQTGDAYLQNFLVGTGSVAAPSAGSLFATSLFGTGHRTLFLLWWDEYDPAPILFYENGLVKQAYISGSNLYDEYSILRLWENNWALSTLTADDAAAATMTEIFGASGPLPLSTSFTVSVGPVVNTPVVFSATTTGGTGPYTVAWNFGDGSSGTGSSLTHTYASAQTFTVTETATDSSSPAQTATSSQSVTVSVAPPLTTGFTVSPTPTVNSPVTFTSTTSGGSPPYTVTWNFGDGATGTGATATHTYLSAQTFQVTETATDSSSPVRTVTSTHSITVYLQPPPGGPFDCTNWNCGNTLSPSSIGVDTNGTAEIRQSNPSACGWSGSYYDSMLRGSFPWGTVTGTPLPSGVTDVSATVNFLSRDLAGSCGVSGSRYHLFIALYYQLGSGVSCPGGGIGANGACWLDTQVRVENIGGVDSPIGTTGTYTSQAIGWDNVTLQLSLGQAGTLTGDVAHQAQQDLLTYGLPLSTQYTLMGVEIGTEGYGFNSINTNWYNVNFVTSNLPPPPSASFTVTPAVLQVGQTASFSGSASGGTSPYNYSWDFGDGATATGQSVTHSYSTGGTYTAVLTVTDSAAQAASASNPVVVSVPVSPDFTIAANPASLTVQVGNSASSTIQLASINSFAGTVSLTASVSPSGPSAGLSPQSLNLASGGPAYATLTVSTVSSTPAGAYDVSLTAVSGALSHVVHISLTVSTTPPPPDFSMSASPSSLTLQAGQSGTSTVTLTSMNGLAGTVSLTPVTVGGLSITLSRNSVTLSSGSSGTITMTISVLANTSPGFYTASTSATVASLQHSVDVTVQVTLPAVNHPPTLTVPGAESVTSGSTLQFTVSAVDIDLGQTLSIGATGLPLGSSFDATSGQFSWTPSSSQLGTWNVTFTAIDDGAPQMSDSKSVPITVQAAQPPPPSTQPPQGQGSCALCQITRVASTNTWLLVAGALAGFMLTLTVVYVRARSRLSDVQRMRRLSRYEDF